MVVRWLRLAFQFVQALFRDPAEVALENVAMRQQLSTFVSKGLRPRVEPADRLFWVCLSRVWSQWTEVLALVKPVTVVRWHREGFGKYWRWKSRRPGRPLIEAQTANLGFAKYVVVKRPARPAREGINPFTKQPTTFAARPASKIVRARPVKAIKDALLLD